MNWIQLLYNHSQILIPKEEEEKNYDFFPLILNDHNYNLLVLNPISILREYVTIIPLHQS